MIQGEGAGYTDDKQAYSVMRQALLSCFVASAVQLSPGLHMCAVLTCAELNFQAHLAKSTQSFAVE